MKIPKSKTITSKDIYGKEHEITLDDLAWRPAAYAIIVKDGKILLVHIDGAYHMPGGGVDIGETPDDAVIREVHEETGLTITAPKLVGSLSTFFTSSHKAMPDEVAHFQSLLLYYTCKLIDGNVTLDHQEHDEKLYGLTPEWVELAKLDGITVGSTVDWRPTVKEALGT